MDTNELISEPSQLGEIEKIERAHSKIEPPLLFGAPPLRDLVFQDEVVRVFAGRENFTNYEAQMRVSRTAVRANVKFYRVQEHGWSTDPAQNRHRIRDFILDLFMVLVHLCNSITFGLSRPVFRRPYIAAITLKWRGVGEYAFARTDVEQLWGLEFSRSCQSCIAMHREREGSAGESSPNPLCSGARSLELKVQEDISERAVLIPHKTKALLELQAAASKFWTLIDREDKTTYPTNDEIVRWLLARGNSKRMSAAIASMLRDDDLPPGPRV